jgi:hypothetical protein
MQEYSFRISNSRRRIPALTNFLSDEHVAYQEGLATFANLARDIANDLQPNSEWRMEIADGLGKPIFILRFSSESLE